MAYNNNYGNYNRGGREWDQGKGYGYDQHDPSSNRIRQREEDYDDYGGGYEKRRKYDNGEWNNQANSYDDGTAWSGYPQQQHSAYNSNADGWQVHDDRNSRGPPQHPNQQYSHPSAAGGNNPNRRRLVPSEPSPHVIFLGLDPDHTEADLHGYLLSMGCVLDNVTIIKDRATGTYPILCQSKGFGFAQFSSMEHAKAFVGPRFPFISIPPPASHGASALQAYKMAVEAGTAMQGRRIKIDFSQSAHPPGRPRHQSNDGTRDIGNTQAPVVLLRGLDLSSSVDIIAEGLRTSAGSDKEGAKGMKRIILLKDKYSTASWGFAFVEFIDVQCSSAFLADLMSPQLHPSGFRIGDRPIAASFAHPYSFQPLGENMLRDDACVTSSLALGGVEDSWVRYWDESAAVEELRFEVDMSSVPASTEKETKHKKKKDPVKTVYAEDPAPVEASTLPVSNKPVTLSFKGGFGATKTATGPVKVVATSALGFTTDNPDAPNDDDETAVSKSTLEHDKSAAARKVAPLIASKKVANNISKWNHVQEELKETVTAISSKVTLEPLTKASAPAASRATTPQDEFEFSDVKGLACLLCSRKFKTLEQLGRHNKESDLHKKNYKDANLREIAAQKMKSLKTPPPQPKYRDRALERRILHNQPDIPLPEPNASGPGLRKHSEDPPQPAPPPPPPVAPAKDENNIGNKLLKKMGWSEGTGLGTDGEGRVDPM
ncbi:hypothetical protein M422DRAFT_781617 [Sphaerobolus stellatus SS14]|uniref:RNA-binding protein 5 n=1 Tax=Sphaerobolus stellatus (strain SS14) TaxID=990650 RepID=A0A0C9V863_SPHS4|nr:hypothetical protein M422DRAFT_781617 [Sphaerobolus stellatus SS14]